MNTAHEHWAKENQTYVVYRASSTMSPYDGYPCAPRRKYVDLLPGVLVPAYHDARVIAV